MPIYEYKCQKCGEEFEVFQGIADPAVKSCKFCKGSVQKIDVPLLLSPEGERLVCHGLRREEGPGGREEERGQDLRNGEEPAPVQDQHRRVTPADTGGCAMSLPCRSSAPCGYPFPFFLATGIFFRRRRWTRKRSTDSWERSFSRAVLSVSTGISTRAALR